MIAFRVSSQDTPLGVRLQRIVAVGSSGLVEGWLVDEVAIRWTTYRELVVLLVATQAARTDDDTLEGN